MIDLLAEIILQSVDFTAFTDAVFRGAGYIYDATKPDDEPEDVSIMYMAKKVAEFLTIFDWMDPSEKAVYNEIKLRA
eukprot:5925502-Pyramimonas_sp.AAC.1